MFGTVDNPFTLNNLNVPAYTTGSRGEALVIFFSNFIKFVIVLAGIYTFWNLISAGFAFLSAGGDAKNVQKAWDKIWQSLIGLVIVAGAFVIAGIFGGLIFGRDNFNIMFSPRIYTP